MKLNSNEAANSVGLRTAVIFFSVVVATAVIFFTGYALVAAGDSGDLSNSTKTVDKTEAAPGGAAQYTIVISNSGGALISGAMMTDTLPAEAIYQSGTLAVTEQDASVTYGYDNGVITMTGDFLVGGQVELSFDVMFTDTLTVGSSVTNTAYIAWDGSTVAKTAVTEIIEADPPDFSDSTKLADKAEAEPGDSLQYTIVISNAGSESATGMIMTDTLPADTVYESGTLTMTESSFAAVTYGYDNGVVTMTGDFLGGGYATLIFDVTLADSLDDGDSVTNAAYIDWSGTTVTKTAVTQIIDTGPKYLYLPVIVRPLPPPPELTLQSTRPGSANQWTLSWTAVGEGTAVSYEIQEAQTPAFSGAATYNPSPTVSDILLANLPWNAGAPYIPSVPAAQVMVLNNALPVRSQEPDFENPTSAFINASTSQTYTHVLSWENEYYYRVRAIGVNSQTGDWSNIVHVVGGYRDDFNDWSSGWDDGNSSGRRRLTNIDETAAYYGYSGSEVGKFIIIVGDRWDWILASPLKKAPEPPYVIEYQAKVHDGSNLISGGMAFGGDWDGSSACPDWNSLEGVYEHTNCFNQFYNFNYIFYGPIKLLHEQVNELVWCPECGHSPMKRLGDMTLIDPTGGVISNDDGLDWHTYRVEVRDDGSRLYIDGSSVRHFSDTTYNDQPYFGVFASADEYKPSIWFFDYFQVTPLD